MEEYYWKGKAKLSLCLTNYALCHEDTWGSGEIAPEFLTSALDGDEQSATRPCRFTPEKNRPWYPFYMRLGGSQSRSGRCGEENNPDMLEIEPGPSSP
jgi:hypothetical protein